MSDQQGGELARVEPIGDLTHQFGAGLPPSLQILLNEGVYNRIKQLAQLMSNAKGITPEHLIGRGEACFAVINIALDAKLNPHFVARHTYQTPGGSIGYDGALVQAMLETSGRFMGSPKLEYVGDWSILVGKFQIKESQRGGKFPVPTWTAQDAIGLGVIVRWQVKGEPSPRVWPGEKEPFQLVQCFPLNSPLWATDPKTQIAYLAIRRFANQAAPGILGAAAYDEAEFLDASERARDITPGANLDEPTDQRGMAGRGADREEPEWEIVDLDGVVQGFSKPDRAIAAIDMLLDAAARDSLDRLEGVWGDNVETVQELAGGFPVEALMAKYAELKEQLQKQTSSATAEERPRQDSVQPAGGDDIPERAAAADPETKPPEARGEAVDGAGSSSEANARQSQPAAAGRSGARGEDDGQSQASAGEAGGSPVAADDRFPGDLPPGERLGLATERTMPRRPPGPTATTAASPSERESKAIPMVIDKQTGKPDYKKWLGVMMIPKMRRNTTTEDLAWFLADNEATIEEALRNVTAADQREWEDAKKQQWARIPSP